MSYVIIIMTSVIFSQLETEKHSLSCLFYAVTGTRSVIALEHKKSAPINGTDFRNFAIKTKQRPNDICKV